MGMVQAIQLFMHHMMIIVKYLKKKWPLPGIQHQSHTNQRVVSTKLSLVRMMKTTRLLLLLLLGNNNINNFGNT